LIARELLRRQWVGPRRPNSRHCRCSTYTKKSRERR
jgi:hypothetical protein